MDDEGKARLVADIVGAMQGVPHEIQVRQIGHFIKADASYGDGIAEGLGIDTAEIG